VPLVTDIPIHAIRISATIATRPVTLIMVFLPELFLEDGFFWGS
jgi:hypothetical protein